MIKILIFLAVIAGAVTGLGYLQDVPGTLNLDWFGYHIETAPVVGLVLALLCAAAAYWAAMRSSAGRSWASRAFSRSEAAGGEKRSRSRRADIWFYSIAGCVVH